MEATCFKLCIFYSSNGRARFEYWGAWAINVHIICVFNHAASTDRAQPSAHWSSSHPQTLCSNPLALSQQLNLPPVSYRILLSYTYNLNTTGAAWHNMSMIDRYIPFEIPVTLPPLNFAFLCISWLIHHACQVCLFNRLTDKVGLHYTVSCLPKCFALNVFCFFFLHFWCEYIVEGVGVGGWGCWMCSRASNWLFSPHVERQRFWEVIDMQITRVHVRIFSGGVVSQCLVNTIMEMCRGFFGSHCLSWITRQSNEPVSMATVTEWGVCLVTHCITAYSRRGRRQKRKKAKWSKFPNPFLCLPHLPKETCANTFCLSFPALTFFFFFEVSKFLFVRFNCLSKHTSCHSVNPLHVGTVFQTAVQLQLEHACASIQHPGLSWRHGVNSVNGAEPWSWWFSDATRWQIEMWCMWSVFA